MIEVRAVARKDVRLSAERERRARDQEETRPPLEPRAPRHREVDERTPERRAEDGPPDVERRLLAREVEDLLVTPRKIDRERDGAGHDAQRAHDEAARDPAPARSLP